MRYSVVMLLGAACLAASNFASAHAFLEHSMPAADAVLDTAPKSVQLWFSRALEPAFSKMRVVDGKGKQVDNGKPVVTDDEPKRISVDLQPLASGKYQVIWRITALDGHKALGKFAFTIK